MATRPVAARDRRAPVPLRRGPDGRPYARARRHRDRGASSMEWALLMPILIIVIMTVVQFALVYHARQVALAAAQSGARTARTQVTGDWQGAAEARARSAVAQIGPKLITPLDVTAGGDANERWVEVQGKASTLVPFMTFTVHERSGGPVECFRPDAGDGTDCERP